IELGEIEALIEQHQAVRQAVARVFERRPDDKRVVAHVVCDDKDSAIVPGLRAHLKRQLPDYMIPSQFVVMKELPLTPNGKIDERAMAAAAAEQAETDGSNTAHSRTPLEETVAGIWRSLIGQAQIGNDDNFFELGGHSLLATQVLARVREVLEVEVDLN